MQASRYKHIIVIIISLYFPLLGNLGQYYQKMQDIWKKLVFSRIQRWWSMNFSSRASCEFILSISAATHQKTLWNSHIKIVRAQNSFESAVFHSWYGGDYELKEKKGNFYGVRKEELDFAPKILSVAPVYSFSSSYCLVGICLLISNDKFATVFKLFENSVCT